MSVAIKKGQQFVLENRIYTFVRFNKNRINQKGARPVVAYITGAENYSFFSFSAFSNAKPLNEQNDDCI